MFLKSAWIYPLIDSEEMNTETQLMVQLTEWLLCKEMPLPLEMCLPFALKRQFVIYFLMKVTDEVAKDITE